MVDDVRRKLRAMWREGLYSVLLAKVFVVFFLLFLMKKKLGLYLLRRLNYVEVHPF